MLARHSLALHSLKSYNFEHKGDLKNYWIASPVCVEGTYNLEHAGKD